MVKKILIASLCAMLLGAHTAPGQERLTRAQIMNMTTEELSELPLEDLMAAVETIGVSSVDELFALIMNKSISSASKHEESTFASPLSTTVITHKEILNYGCTTIEEAFRLIPGMIVTQKTNGVYDVQLRGLNNIPDNNLLLYTENNNTLLMVDGRIVHNYTIGTMNAENLPIGIADVERIEVVRGAASALYGVNAVNGVINIITQRPSADSPVVTGSFQMGNMGTVVADGAIRKAFGQKVAVGVSFNVQQRERPTDGLWTYFAEDDEVYLDPGNYLVTGESYAIGRQDLDELVADGYLMRVRANELRSVNDFHHMKLMKPSSLSLTSGSQGGEEELVAYGMIPPAYSDLTKMFSNPGIARKNIGINGYVSLTPRPRTRVDISGGYSQSLVMNTNLLLEPYSFYFREQKKGYVNVNADIRDLHLTASYSAGPEDYAKGRPSFQVKTQQIFATAGYEFHVGDIATWGALTIRPGVAYQYVYAYDDAGQYYTPLGSTDSQRLSDFFDGYAELWATAPSLRLDYVKGGFRAVAALRSDKTKTPDRWNTSAQASLSYNFRDKRSLRVTYGRGFRSANLLNTNANFTWDRSGMQMPTEMQFSGNKEAAIMHIDNFEIGYRTRPIPKLLIDGEVFYSISKDYGAMMSPRSEVAVPLGSLSNFDFSSLDLDLEDPSVLNYVNSQFLEAYGNGTFITRNYVQYDNLPYTAYQLGAGVNVDWIISPKVLMKFNVNLQRTWIDNYYEYRQLENISQQLGRSVAGSASTLLNVLGGSLGYDFDPATRSYTRNPNSTITAQWFFEQATEKISNLEALQSQYAQMSPAERQAFASALRDAWLTGQVSATYGGTTYEHPMVLYHGLVYGMRNNGREITLGSTYSEQSNLRSGHEHKATPRLYGMIGVVVKPTQRWNVSAYANYVGKREYGTAYTQTRFAPRVTVNAKVGWKPFDACEFFVNANNMLNNKSREFVYSDKIGGTYTVGLNITM